MLEVCVTGHEQETAAKILKHYLAQHLEFADSATAKLIAWFDGQPTGDAP